MTKKQLNKSQIREINEKIQELYAKEDFFAKKERVEIIDNEYLVRDGTHLFFYHDSKPVPTLKLLLKEDILKKVYVDMGAVRFVTKGADIMRPGITTAQEGIQKGDFVVIVDETHGKPLAVGHMLISGEELMTQTGGKVIKNLHYIGDKLWQLG